MAVGLEHVTPSGQKILFRLTDWPATIGRDPSNTLAVDEAGVLGKHATLLPAEGRYCLVDLGSAEGIEVNGTPVRSHMLAHGDALRFGTVRLVFRTDLPDPPASGLGAFTPEMPARPPAATTLGLPEDHPEVLDVERILEELDELMNAEELQKLDVAAVRPYVQEATRRTEALQAAKATLARLGGEALAAEFGDFERVRLYMKLMYREAWRLNHERPLREYLGELLEFAAQATGAERGFLSLKPGAGAGGGTELSYCQQSAGGDCGPPCRAIQQMAETQQVAILAHDAQIDGRFSQDDTVQLHGVRSVLCVPIWEAGRVAGTLYVDRLRSGQAFDVDEMEMLTGLCSLAGVRIRLESPARPAGSERPSGSGVQPAAS